MNPKKELLWSPWVWLLTSINSLGCAKREFPKIRGTLFWGPYNKDPTISTRTLALGRHGFTVSYYSGYYSRVPYFRKLPNHKGQMRPEEARKLLDQTRRNQDKTRSSQKPYCHSRNGILQNKTQTAQAVS